MSFDCMPKVVTIDENHSIDVISIPKLKLYIISDMKNFGSNWIQVFYSHQNNVYTTKTLLGAEDHSLAPICRYLAQHIIDNKPSMADSLEATHELVLTFNICLKNIDITDRDIVRQIGEQLI